jgi:hypothetical protein
MEEKRGDAPRRLARESIWTPPPRSATLPALSPEAEASGPSDRLRFHLVSSQGAASVNQARWIVVVTCLAFTLASAHAGAETKSGLNWNPFAKTSASKPAASSSKSSGFKLPSLWPASAEKKRPTEPSAWEKFSRETKSMFEKTTDTLTFWDNDQPAKKSQGYDSVRSRFGVKKKEDEKKSFFSSWFSSEDDKPAKPRTVSEFLSQDKPQP